MKNFAVIIAALVLAVLPARAQVTVAVQFESEQFIANEPIIAKVRISNDSGTTLRLGEDPSWLGFAIEPMEGPYVKTLAPVRVAETFILESSHTATTRVDLTPAYDLTARGKYRVVATVKVPAFNTSFASPGKEFYIVPGAVIWEREFGVPTNISAPDANGLPEIRKFILMQSTSGKDTKCYVRVADRQGNNLRVIPIGTLVSFSRPEPQLDKWSNLHVLYQIGAKTFNYTVVNAEGFLVARETHEYSETRPTLVINDEGRIQVRGGNRRPTAEDVPPFDAAQLPGSTDHAARSALRAASANAPETALPSAKKSPATVNAKEKKKK